MEQPCENWQLYCDMDGVLVDFNSSAIALVNDYYKRDNIDHIVTRDEFDSKARDSELGLLVQQLISHNEEFWIELDWNPGGQQLWEHIKRYDPILLTGPTGPASYIGKEAWVRNHLGNNVDILYTHNKWKYAMKDGVKGVLIDDKLEQYLMPFHEHGGVIVHHENVMTTLRTLIALGIE